MEQQPKPRTSRHRRPESSRRDGWTPDRQLRFLETLQRTRSVSAAAKAAGMSREGAYRLCERPEGALFSALWDRILGPALVAGGEGHIRSLSNGALMRLLGIHFRRERGDFAGGIGRAGKTRGG